MNLSNMLAGIAAIAPLISSVISIVRKAVTNKDDALQIEAKLRELEVMIAYQRDADQLRVNEAEANSDSLFVAGWRPYIGWIGGFALTWHYIIVPVVVFIGGIFHYTIPVPAFDLVTLINLVIGMLGMGYMRTIEKKQVEANKQEIRLAKAGAEIEAKNKKVGLDATFSAE